MYLKELTINGFKSFAKKSELEFSAPITAIVGPNGSGKSNVAESFRFVLGEQSVKSMRGKRGEDLIWGGSEKVSRGNRAAVELLFDNTSRVFALDFDEVKIERTVHRDGQNEYKINGSAVRLKDVHELLAGANVGSTGHHIISQGEADRVIAAGPKERREMIEDALGLKVYQLKKQETERKLNKTRDNIAQTESLRREAAPHLKYLKKQVEKAERSLELQKVLRTKYAEYLKREDVYVAQHFDRLTASRVAPAKRLAELQQTIKDLKQTLAKNELTPDTSELDTAEAALQDAAKARREAEQALGKVQGQVQFLEQRLNAPNETTKAKSVIAREEVADVVLQVEKEIERALTKGGEATFERALNDTVHRLRTFLQKSEGKVIDTSAADKAELETLTDELERISKQVDTAIAAEDQARSVVEQVRAAQVDQSEQSRADERQLFEHLNEQRDLESQVTQIDRELAHLERDRDDFKNQLQEAVALLGRHAADYFSVEVLGVDGSVLAAEAIVSEDRTKQRERLHELEKLKIRLEELGVGATEDLVKEYEEAKARDEFLAKELQDLEQSVENLESLITEMQEKLREQFTAGLEKITTEFHSFFTLMFGGGSAALNRVEIKKRNDEDEDPAESPSAEEGVELAVVLPNKRVKGLDMLSGGERALTSIALIFAMSQVNPPPFIILDETDAALDEANSRRYGDMIEALAKKSQLVLITHNRETMSRAGILYGITMAGDGASKVLSVKFDEAAAVAK